MTTPAIKLVVSDNCPFCHRSALVLLEKAATFEVVSVELRNKHSYKHLLSPYGRVPVLWHGDRPIYESSIINEFIDELCPAPSLMPRSAEARAEARFWIDFCNTRFMPAYFNLLKERNLAKRDPLRAALMDHLRFIETVGLAKIDGSRPYWLGSDVSLVDFAFYPFFERFVSVETYRGISIPAGYERLACWREAMRGREAVRKLERPREHYIEYFRKPYADA